MSSQIYNFPAGGSVYINYSSGITDEPNDFISADYSDRQTIFEDILNDEQQSGDMFTPDYFMLVE